MKLLKNDKIKAGQYSIDTALQSKVKKMKNISKLVLFALVIAFQSCSNEKKKTVEQKSSDNTTIINEQNNANKNLLLDIEGNYYFKEDGFL